MKIAFFLADLYGGGAEKTTLLLINALAKQHQVALFIVREEGAFIKEISTEVSVYILGTRSVYRSFFALYRALWDYQPDILISSLDTPNLLATLVSKVSSFKNITIVHGIVSFKYRQQYSMRILIRLLRYSTLTIAVSKGVQSDLKKFSIPSKVIYNPFVLSGSVSRREKVILAVGRLEQVKNHKMLIEAFSLAKLEGYSLYILGEGSLYQELLDYIEQKRIQNVYLPGFQNPEDFYMKASLLVSSSLSESFGNVLVEALGYGINIVATQTVGSKEILEEGKFGTLVPCHEVHSLAKAIKERLDKPLDVQILQNRAHDFSIDHIVSCYEKTIYEVCNVSIN